MTTIRPLNAPAIPQATTPAQRPAAAPAQGTFAQRMQGAGAAQPQQASQTPGHSKDDGSRPLSPTELQEELRSVALQQGLMMGQRLLSMAASVPKIDAAD